MPHGCWRRTRARESSTAPGPAPARIRQREAATPGAASRSSASSRPQPPHVRWRLYGSTDVRDAALAFATAEARRRAQLTRHGIGEQVHGGQIRRSGDAVPAAWREHRETYLVHPAQVWT